MNYRQSVLAATEFRLLVECCRWTFAGNGEEAVAGLAGSIDWERFLHLARRHRVQAIVRHCLDGLGINPPAEVGRRLAADADAIVQQNLLAAIACKRLCEGFRDAGIEALFVKGLTLGKLAYPSPFLKMSWDVDLLVAPGAVADAAALLRRLGYHLMVPPSAPEKWHETRKESLWRGPDDVHLELHSRLADSLDLLASLSVASPRQEVEIAPGVVLPTLATRELFAYLCVHGASSAWFRLKWITDFAALLNGCTEKRIAELYRESQELGAGRAAAQALLLANRIYRTPLDRGLRAELGRDRANRWLADAAAAQLARPGEPTGERLGTLMIHLTQLFLRPGWPFKLGELRRQVSDAAGNRL